MRLVDPPQRPVVGLTGPGVRSRTLRCDSAPDLLGRGDPFPGSRVVIGFPPPAFRLGIAGLLRIESGHGPLGWHGVVFNLEGGGRRTAPGDLRVAIRQADLETMPLAGIQRWQATGGPLGGD